MSMGAHGPPWTEETREGNSILRALRAVAVGEAVPLALQRETTTTSDAELKHVGTRRTPESPFPPSVLSLASAIVGQTPPKVSWYGI